MDAYYFNTDSVSLSRKPVDTLDFRQQSWGHALHSSTFREVTAPSRNPITLIRDRLQNARRYSFMVHSHHHPRPGQKVIWNSEGGVVEGVLYDYTCAPNVRDMFTLFVIVTGPLPLS